MKTYTTDQFNWVSKNQRFTATVTDLGVTDHRFPKDFKLWNPKTGNSVRFVIDDEAMELNEFFDGEAAQYFCLDNTGLSARIWLG